MLSEAGDMVTGRQRLICVQTGDHIDDQKADPVRGTVVARIDGHEPREGLHDGVGTGLFAQRALLSIAAHG